MLHLLIILLQCFLCTTSNEATTGPSLVYLKGVHRLNDSGYTDYYFCCNVYGRFLQWYYNTVQLSSFGTEDAGVVVVGERSGYEYTATLLSSRNNVEGSQETLLDSILVLSFNNVPPSEFEITCSSGATSSSSDYNSTTIVDELTDGQHNSSNHNDISLDYILSRQILKNDTRYTHIFICGTAVMQQFFEVSGPPIGFGREDGIGESRTVWSEYRSIVNVQGVLIARQPYTSTSLLFVSEPSDVTVMCFYGASEVRLTSNYTKFATDSETTTSQLPDSPSSSDFLASSSVTTTTETLIPSESSSNLTSTSAIGVKIMSPSDESAQGSYVVIIMSISIVTGVVIGIVTIVTLVLISLRVFRRRQKCTVSQVVAQPENPPTKKPQLILIQNDGPEDLEVGTRERDPLLNSSSSFRLIDHESTAGLRSQKLMSFSTCTEEEEKHEISCGWSCCPVTLPHQCETKQRLRRSFSHPETSEPKGHQPIPTCSSFSKTEEDVEKIFVSNMGSVLIRGGLRHRRTSSLNVAYLQPDTPDCIREDKSPEKTEVNFTQQECDISRDKCSQEKDNAPTRSPDKIDVNCTQQECDICPNECPQENNNACTSVSDLQCYNTCYNSRELESLSFHITDYVTLMKELSSHGDMDPVWYDLENGLVNDPNKHFWPEKFPDALMSIPLTNLPFLTPLSRGPMIKYMPNTSKDFNLVLLEVLEVMKDGLTMSEVLEIMKDVFQAYQVMQLPQLTQH